MSDAELIDSGIECVIVAKTKIVIKRHASPDDEASELTIPWFVAAPSSVSIEHPGTGNREPDPKLVRALARAHARMQDLTSGRFETIEALAESANTHPKMLRKELHLAFLAPDIVEAILHGEQPDGLTLTQDAAGASIIMGRSASIARVLGRRNILFPLSAASRIVKIRRDHL